MINRRKFLSLTAKTSVLGLCAGYPLWEARHYAVSKFTIPVPRLPAAFEGFKVTFIADTHFGPFAPISYIAQIVQGANALGSPLIVLGGDYVYRSAKYIEPVMAELGKLRAPLGVYAVPGNHDNSAGRQLTTRSLAANGIMEIRNKGHWISLGGERLRLCGIDDLWTGVPRIPEALGDAKDKDCCLLVSHNPDVAEGLADPRVSLVLSGHTHGGQMNLPIIGSPIIPSAFGQKYAYGLVQAPNVRAFVTCGTGTIFPPIRINRPPEIALLTLTAG